MAGWAGFIVGSRLFVGGCVGGCERGVRVVWTWLRVSRVTAVSELSTSSRQRPSPWNPPRPLVTFPFHLSAGSPICPRVARPQAHAPAPCLAAVTRAKMPQRRRVASKPVGWKATAEPLSSTDRSSSSGRSPRGHAVGRNDSEGRVVRCKRPRDPPAPLLHLGLRAGMQFGLISFGTIWAARHSDA